VRAVDYHADEQLARASDASSSEEDMAALIEVS
jgi:hypothetical protein